MFKGKTTNWLYKRIVTSSRRKTDKQTYCCNAARTPLLWLFCLPFSVLPKNWCLQCNGSYADISFSYKVWAKTWLRIVRMPLKKWKKDKENAQEHIRECPNGTKRTFYLIKRVIISLEKIFYTSLLQTKYIKSKCI